MASTKRTRHVTPRRIETIILKDLQSLHKWKEGATHHTGKERGHCYSSLLDDERLLCNETPEDLEEVWARPPQPKWVKKSQSKWSHSKTAACQELSKDGDVWATPLKGKRAKKAQCKQTAWRHTQPQSAEPASPVIPSVAPPNSPAELSPASQPTSNPYITYLIQSWEMGSPVLVTSLSAPGQPTVQPGCGSASLVSLQDSNVNLMLIRPEDVLVIPDSSREVISVPTHTGQDTEGDAAQCVPQTDGLHQRQSPEFGEESVFAEDDFLSSESSQETGCQQDHVVPHFEPEE